MLLQQFLMIVISMRCWLVGWLGQSWNNPLYLFTVAYTMKCKDFKNIENSHCSDNTDMEI